MTTERDKSPDIEKLSFQELVQIDGALDRDFLEHIAAAISAEDRTDLVARFYEHIGRFPELRELLDVDDRAVSLRASMERYLKSLLGDPIDDVYVGNRRRIGQTHLRVGLSPVWYLGAYSAFISWGFQKIRDRDRLEVFLRRLLLDMVLVIDTYVQARVEHLNREKSDLDLAIRERSRRLVESERRYDDLVDNAPEMIHQLDSGMRFLSVNRRELVRLGYTLDEMKGMSVEDIVPSAYREGIRAHFNRVRLEGASSLETVFVTKSGEEFPVEIYATVQTGTDGAFLQTRAFVRDLSERNRLERELIRWERLAAVGSMAAKVAHEIRNPLSSISLDAELLADEMQALPDSRRAQARELLTAIMGGVDRLNSLVEEYLAFARLPIPDLVETSLPEIFGRLRQLLGPELMRRKINLEIDIAEDLPLIPGDSRQLEQVFLNLIRNSQDAMPKGGTIRIVATGDKKKVEVVVSDTGVGIPEESLPLIFDPFFTTKDAGTGLGLAHVQQVLQEHQARIKCSSRLGKGTEFNIQFHTTFAAVRRRQAEGPGT